MFAMQKFLRPTASSLARSSIRLNAMQGKVATEPTSKKAADFSQLRMYKDRSMGDLLNMYIMNTLCTRDVFVDNCHHLYNFSNKFLGKWVTETAVSSTMGKLFTAGNTLQSVESFINSWPNKKVNIYIDYSNEAAPGQVITPEQLDETMRVFCETIKLASKAGSKSGIAIKISALCLPEVLHKANTAQVNVQNIFSTGYGNLTEKKTTGQLFNAFKDMKLDMTFGDFQEFLSVFFNKSVNSEQELESVYISKLEWLNNMHAFYIQNQHKNSNKMLSQITKFSAKDYLELGFLTERFDAVLKLAHQEKCTVLCDAEQTYFQASIDSFTNQFTEIYNKSFPVALNTFQNYLKSTNERVVYEIERCKSLDLLLGAKLVRGAYMVEERRLAKEYNYIDPIHDTIEETHACYNNNLKHVITNWIPGSHLMVASHNEESVYLGKSLVKEQNITQDKGHVSFVQLLGLADHLTFSSAEEGYTAAKYVPFGPIPIMIPYLIRRAQESKQMLSSAALQRYFVISELGKRIKRQ